MKGGEFGASILALEGDKRERAILQAALVPANLPGWLRGPWVPIVVGDLTFFAEPDYDSIGEDGDFLRLSMTPATAQKIADARNSILPTRKMVAAIYAAADTKLPSKTYAPDSKMESTARMIEHNAAIGNNHPSLSNLLAGHKKDIVIGPDLDGSHVAIYGWQPDPKVYPYQPYSTVHGASYADYSHGVRLVHRVMLWKGQPVDAEEIFRDPARSKLVSDQGVFVPRFPNKGAVFSPVALGGGGGGGGASPAGAAGVVLVSAMIGGALGGPLGAVVGGVAGSLLAKK